MQFIQAWKSKLTENGFPMSMISPLWFFPFYEWLDLLLNHWRSQLPNKGCFVYFKYVKNGSIPQGIINYWFTNYFGTVFFFKEV